MTTPLLLKLVTLIPPSGCKLAILLLSAAVITFISSKLRLLTTKPTLAGTNSMSCPCSASRGRLAAQLELLPISLPELRELALATLPLIDFPSGTTIPSRNVLTPLTFSSPVLFTFPAKEETRPPAIESAPSPSPVKN